MQSSRSRTPGHPASAPSPRSAAALYRRAGRRHRGSLTASVLLLVGWQVCEALVPIAIGFAIDDAVAGGDLWRLLWWALAFCLLFATLSTCYRLGSRAGFAVMQRESHALRVEIARTVLRPEGSTAGRTPGQTLSVATTDAEVAATIVRQVAITTASMASIVVCAVVLLRTDVVVGLVVLLGVPLVLGVLQLLTPMVSRGASVQQAEAAASSGVATDLLGGLRVLKGIGGEDEAAARYRRVSRRSALASVVTAGATSRVAGATTALSGVFLAVVALLAGRLALQGRISVGEFIAVVGLTQFIAEPLRLLGDTSADAATSLASARRVVDVLNAAPLVAAGHAGADGAGTPAPVPGAAAVELTDVHHGPLRGIAVRVEPGEFVALLSDAPGTAEAVADVLCGEVAAADHRGRVLVDGLDLTTLPVIYLVRRVLVSRHEIDLFDGTLRSNLLGSDPDATTGGTGDTALDEALRASGAAEVVRAHPEGLDHRVSPGGGTFSGGQRQRIALARALHADPEVLVLCEPTTAVDAVTEQQVAQGIRAFRHHGRRTRTTLVVSSSPALLAVADRVVVLLDGRTAREGTHQDLMAADEDYRRRVLR